MRRAANTAAATLVRDETFGEVGASSSSDAGYGPALGTLLMHNEPTRKSHCITIRYWVSCCCAWSLQLRERCEVAGEGDLACLICVSAKGDVVQFAKTLCGGARQTTGDVAPNRVTQLGNHAGRHGIEQRAVGHAGAGKWERYVEAVARLPRDEVHMVMKNILAGSCPRIHDDVDVVSPIEPSHHG